MSPIPWRRTALLVAVFLFAGGPRLCAAADELGNLEGPSVPELKAPGTATPAPPFVPDVQSPDPVAPGRIPAEPAPPVLSGVLPSRDAAAVSGNGTLPSGVFILPFSNSSLPASNATLPEIVIPVEPLRNATFPVKPEKAEAERPAGLSPADFLPKIDAGTAPAQAEPPRQKKAKPSERPEKKIAAKPEPRKTPVKGDPLQIPQEAQKTGKVDFMEGCWVGRRPEYHTKRMITERFCFDAKGVGKRMISDPTHAGQCVGAAKATMLPGGVLRILSERGRCTSGKKWGQADMTCRGEGRNTPCSWVFRDVNSGAHQAYTITFVRD